MVRRFSIGLGVALVAAACSGAGTGASPASSAAAPAGSLERYLPLKDGMVFSYDTLAEGSGERGILVLRVRRPRPDRAELIGGRTERLDFAPNAITYATGGTLLQQPLTVGSTWKGRSGTVRLVNVDRRVEVPAGTFTGCLETLEEAPELKVTTVFCPEVGIVSIEAEGAVQEDYQREVARLRYFGPAVDLEAEPSSTGSP